MNRIVREHYPVAKLPEELREGFAPDADVTVVVEAVSEGGSDTIAAAGDAEPTQFLITRLLEELRDQRVTEIDPVDRVRSARAEWGVRDEHHNRIRRESRT